MARNDAACREGYIHTYIHTWIFCVVRISARDPVNVNVRAERQKRLYAVFF